MICAHCNEPVAGAQKGSWEQVTGWTQKRSQGGANKVALARPTGKVMHEACFNAAKYGEPLFR